MAVETAQTLDRGLRVLELLAATPAGISVTELAAALEVSRTVVYRLVATLEQHELLRRSSDGRCRLGLGIVGLARSVHLPLREAVAPHLRRLAEGAGVTAHFTVVDGADVLAVAVVEPRGFDEHVAYRVGARHSLERGAAGRAVLAARLAAARATAAPPWVTSAAEVQPGTSGVATAVLGVPGLEASVGVLAIGVLDAGVVGPRVVRAAQEVTRALR